jgi:hypothetical protein
MDEEKGDWEFTIFFGLFLVIIISLSVGLTYLVTAFAYKHTYTGTLTNVHTARKCFDDDCTWKIVENFQKGNYPKTCQVERLKEYFPESRANHVVNKTILGTQRQIWEYWNNADRCYDQNIRDYNLQVAITLLAFTGFVVCCSYCIVKYYQEGGFSRVPAAPPVVKTNQPPSAVNNDSQMNFTHLDIEIADTEDRKL